MHPADLAIKINKAASVAVALGVVAIIGYVIAFA